MGNRKTITSRMVLAAFSVFCCLGVSVAARGANDVLVVPNRYTVVQLGFDIMALRDVALIACDAAADADNPILHVWSRRRNAWERLSVNEYAMGTFVAGDIDTMILVGSDSVLPRDVVVGAAQADTQKRIETLHIATIVNTLNKSMALTAGEWKWLAKRHNLTIKDRNAARRRWGRYGPPKGKRCDVAPVPVIESPAETEVPSASPENVEAEMNAAFDLDEASLAVEDTDSVDASPSASASDMETVQAEEAVSAEAPVCAPAETAPAVETAEAEATIVEEKGVPAEMLEPSTEPDPETTAAPEAESASVPESGPAITLEPAPEDK